MLTKSKCRAITITEFLGKFNGTISSSRATRTLYQAKAGVSVTGNYCDMINVSNDNGDNRRSLVLL